MATPRISKAAPATFVWSDGTVFNGFYLMALVPPVIGGSDAARFALNTYAPECRIPQWAVIPIKAGSLSQDVGILYNEDINPPGTKYAAYLYDVSKRMVDGPTSPFIVNTTTFNPSFSAPTAPSTSGTTPTPDTNTTSSPVIYVSCFGGYYTASIVANHVTIDLANGLNQRVVLNQAAQVTIDNPIYTGMSFEAGMTFNLFIYQDGTGGRPTPAFGAAFDTSVALAEMPTSANSYLSYQFVRHNDGVWRLNFIGPLFP